MLSQVGLVASVFDCRKHATGHVGIKWNEPGVACIHHRVSFDENAGHGPNEKLRSEARLGPASAFIEK